MTGGLVAGPVVIPEDELSERFSRSSGPGGQYVNTADTRVELSWDVAESAAVTQIQRERLLSRLDNRLARGVLTVAVSDFRSQWRNRQTARVRMAAVVSEAVRAPARTRRATRPSRSAREARLDGKRRHATTKRERRRPGRWD